MAKYLVSNLSALPAVERQHPTDIATGKLFTRGDTALVKTLDMTDYEIVPGQHDGRIIARTSPR